MSKLLLKPSEAFDRLGLPKNRGWGWLHAGIIPHIKDGARYYVPAKALDALAERIASGEMREV